LIGCALNLAAYATSANYVLTVAGGTSHLTFATPAGGVAAVSKLSPGKAVLSGFAFESLRQDTTTSANDRTQVLEKIFGFVGAVPTPTPPLSTGAGSWTLFQ